MEQRATETQPVFDAAILADAIGRKLLVSVVADLLRLGPTQDIDDVAHAEALLRAHDAGEKLLRVYRAVFDHLLVQAIIAVAARSEEHTSELQSRENLVCRLLL